MEQFTEEQLVDHGICPTCYDREHEHCLYGYHPERIVYKNFCLLLRTQNLTHRVTTCKQRATSAVRNFI